MSMFFPVWHICILKPGGGKRLIVDGARVSNLVQEKSIAEKAKASHSQKWVSLNLAWRNG